MKPVLGRLPSSSVAPFGGSMLLLPSLPAGTSWSRMACPVRPCPRCASSTWAPCSWTRRRTVHGGSAGSWSWGGEAGSTWAGWVSTRFEGMSKNSQRFFWWKSSTHRGFWRGFGEGKSSIGLTALMEFYFVVHLVVGWSCQV